MEYGGQTAGAQPPPLPAMVNGRRCIGAHAVIRVDDEGLLRGDGAFEVILLHRGRPFALREHLDRLRRSCETLRLARPDVGELTRRVAALAEEASGLETCALRVVITRGGAELLLLERHARQTEPLRLLTVRHEPTPLLLGAKSLSYAANRLATRLARERGADEALFVTREDRVLEGPTSSFFWVDEEGRLCTPPLTDPILDSITRRVLVSSLPVSERTCTRDQALAAREAFLASTLREIQPVAGIDGVALPVVDGEATAGARRAFVAAVERELADDPIAE